jgi:PST family polysaccharide transporter
MPVRGSHPAAVSEHQTPLHTARRAGNYLILSAAEAAGKLFNFAAFTHLGRTLGPEQYGLLEFVIAVMAFFTLAADMGLSVCGAREVAKNPSFVPSLASEIVFARGALTFLTAVALFAGLPWLPVPEAARGLLYLYGVSLFGSPLLIQWYFQGREAMAWVAAASVIRNGVFAGLVLAAIRTASPLWHVGWIECAAVVCTAGFCLAAARQRFGLKVSSMHVTLRSAWRRLREAVPLGLAELTWAAMWYLSTTLLGLWRTDASLGWFGASHRVVMALHTFVWLYFYNLLPAVSRFAGSSSEQLRHTITSSLRLTAWLSVFAAWTLGLLAPVLLPIAFGPSFASGGSLLQALVWMIPITMLSGHYRYTLIACGLQKRLLAGTATGAITTAALGVWLIPRWGATGAVWCLLAGGLADFACAYSFVRRGVTPIPFLKSLLGPAAAAAAAALSLSLGRLWFGASGAAIGGIFTYLTCAFICERSFLTRVIYRIFGQGEHHA